MFARAEPLSMQALAAESIPNPLMSIPSIPAVSSLVYRSLVVVSLELARGRYRREHVEVLPAPLLAEVLRSAKSANVLNNDTLDLFFGRESFEFVLSGASSYATRLPTAFPQHLLKIGLYNCSALLSEHLNYIFERSHLVEELNVGRVKALCDQHVLAFSQKAPRLKTLVLNRNAQLTDAALGSLHELRDLIELSIFACTGFKKPARHIGACAGIQVLSISKVRGFDEDSEWVHLCALKNLTSLVAQRVPMTHVALKMCLRAWPHLHKLDLLPGSKITGAEFTAAVQECGINLCWVAFPGGVNMLSLIGPQLRVLNFSKSAQIPASMLLQALRGAPLLREFSMLRPHRGSIDDSILTHLFRMEHMQLIFISGADEITDAPFEALEPRSCPRLELLELAQCPIGTRAVQCIVEACSKLKQLNITATPALHHSTTTAAIGLRCDNLRSLNISGYASERVGGFDHVVGSLLFRSHLLLLKLLNMSYTHLTQRGCATLLRCLPRLKSLDISYSEVGAEPFDPSATKGLPELLLLHTLSADGNNGASLFLKAIVSRMRVLGHLSCNSIPNVAQCFPAYPTTLVSLNISRCEVLSVDLAKLPSSIRILNLSYNPIDDSSLRILVEHEPNLEVLHVSGCRTLTNAAFDCGTFPTLESIHTQDTSITSLGALAAQPGAVLWIK